MENKYEIFKELIELSQREKRGLTIYFNGLTTAGVVVRIIGTEAVELKSQMYSRTVVRLDSIDAAAVN